VLPNVGPYVYDVKLCDFTRSSIYIYYISRIRLKCEAGTNDDGHTPDASPAA
jgi:hypothetical protein